MDAARDPVQPIELAAYEPLFFRIRANLLIDPAYLPEKVLAAVTSALQTAYAFAVRTFGQPVHKSEVMALIQAVEGVQAVQLIELYLKGQPPSLQSHLAARQATRTNNLTQLAQLLLLDPAGLALAEVTQ
jgi:phage-related baseplate assembly protein